MYAMSPGKKGLIALAVILFGSLFVSAAASNIALFMAKVHDGELHVLSVWSLLTGPDEEMESYAALSLMVSFLVPFFTVGAIVKSRGPSLHGKARWATDREIKKGGLHADKGILVGKRGGSYLTFGGSEHVMVYAPTRGGKGVGIVIPNLLNWPDSCVVLDIKKENWNLTAGFRAKHGQDVFLFDPLERDGRTARYNPFAYVDRSNSVDLYDDLQKIGAMLLPVEQQGDAFWTRSARTGFLAVAGYIAETPALPFTIGEVYRQLSVSADLKTHFLTEIKNREDSAAALSGQCKTAMNDFLAASQNTFSSVRKTISAQLELWNNARIDQATSGNDFDLRELRRKPISIYIGVTPDNLARMAPLINLFFQQVVDLNTRVLPHDDKTLTKQVMMMLDEFPAIGNVGIIQKSIAYVAAYGIRLVTIVQSPSQLFGVYGEHEARNYMTNHAIEVVYTPKELAVSEELSKRFGTDTIKSRSISKGAGFSARSTSKSQSISDQGRALILPQELVLTPFEREYIIKGGMRPVVAEKILYFKDKVFSARIMDPPIVEPIVFDPPAGLPGSARGSAPVTKTVVTIRDAEPDDKSAIVRGDAEVVFAEFTDVGLEFGDVALEGTEEQRRAEISFMVSDMLSIEDKDMEAAR